MDRQKPKYNHTLWTDRDTFMEECSRAVEEEQFILYLQPKFRIKGDRIYGAEVLVRWNHPEKGLLEPRDFLPLCEQYDLMSGLDYYVWEHACQMLQKWNEAKIPLCALSVKVSRASLYHAKIDYWLNQLLDTYQVPKEYLQLEIEEDSIRADIYQAQEAIHCLHGEGYTILLDDFSYGCSSVSALNQIDVDILKVDMKFFSDCNNAGKGEVILAGIIKSVNWLGISVLAECVETKEQKAFATTRGCNLVQGFYFSKPLPEAEFEERYMKKEETPGGRNGNLVLPGKTNQPAHNLSVLVIDDSEMELNLLETYLKGEFHIHTAASAEEGLNFLRVHKSQVDLILVDYMMPQMDGLEFLRYCQNDIELKNIPKIMITSNERAQDQIQAFQAGAYDYLLKPLIPELVRIRIRHAMELNDKILISEHEKIEYKHRAELDYATGILNKMTFQRYVEQHLERNRLEADVLYIIDIDDFKNVNDTQGHLVGDEVIKLIAKKLGHIFRSSDYVGRFGGDEFTVFMMNVKDQEKIKTKAKAILQEVTKGVETELGIHITTSIGIGNRVQEDDFASLFARADEALYRAKNAGKGTYRI